MESPSITLAGTVFCVVLLLSIPHPTSASRGGFEWQTEGQGTVGRVAAFQSQLERLQGGKDQRSKGARKFPMSPTQQARTTGLWWKSEETLNLVLMEAEEKYNRNIEKQRQGERAGNPGWARDSPPPGAPPGPSPFTFIDRLFVATYPCPLEARLGAWGDGGKWVCLSHFKSENFQPVVVSVGSNGDTSFESDVVETLGVATHTLDFSLKPDVAERVSSLPFVNFYPVGLTGERQREKYKKRLKKFGEVKLLTFPEVLDLVGQRYIDIFKVDCELCEYEMVRDLGVRYTKENVPIGQIQLELHRCADVALTSQLFSVLTTLGFRLFHVEINIYGAAYNSWQYEVSFIHERHVQPRTV